LAFGVAVGESGRERVSVYGFVYTEADAGTEGDTGAKGDTDTHNGAHSGKRRRTY
jgi:hypothetical protein